MEDRPRSVHIRAIHLPRIANPEAIICRNVEDNIAPGSSLFERCRIAQVAGDEVGAQILDVSGIARGADEQTQICALLGYGASDVAADKYRSAGDKSKH